jgi:hypothetical protein
MFFHSYVIYVFHYVPNPVASHCVTAWTGIAPGHGPALSGMQKSPNGAAEATIAWDGEMAKKNHDWLVVLTILKNMKVNGKDDIPYMKWKIKNV